jgi:ribonuclease HI
LFALNQALKHFKDKEVTIYTDSKYSFGVVHTFGKIWMERGFNQQQGQDLVHGELIQQIESLKLPEEIAIVHMPIPSQTSIKRVSHLSESKQALRQKPAGGRNPGL